MWKKLEIQHENGSWKHNDMVRNFGWEQYVGLDYVQRLIDLAIFKTVI